jgi:transposase InsO family protein
MPWREQSVVDQREEFVRLAVQPDANLSELCRRFGISRPKGIKWKNRFLSEGVEGLRDRSRRPHRSPARTHDPVEAEVLRIRAKSNNAWGGRKIARVMHDNGWLEIPAPSTITEILRRHGQLEGRASEHPGPFKRFERAAPNELWQMDYKGHFALLRGRCHPLTVLDDHSRYSVGLEACEDERGATVQERLTNIFRRHGRPLQMLMDNGSPWGEDRGWGHTFLTVWLIRLGISVAHGRPYHPQTQGKEERFHRTLNAEVIRPGDLRDIEHCQRAFDIWRNVYNHERPHEALNLDTPSSRYRISPWPFPEVLPPIEYPPADAVRKVDIDGHFYFKNRRWRLSKAFRRQPVALRPTRQDGLFSVHFCHQLLGTIDMRNLAVGACGLVDIARAARKDPAAMPTTPQAQQQNQFDSNG